MVFEPQYHCGHFGKRRNVLLQYFGTVACSRDADIFARHLVRRFALAIHIPVCSFAFVCDRSRCAALHPGARARMIFG